MKFYQLAFRYLCRKKSKTFILLLVLLFINSMILGSYMILHATEDSRITMQEKMGTKAVLEVKGSDRFITENEVREIRDMDGVISVNRMADSAVYPVNFNPITNSDSEDENNWKVTLLSYDELERDSAFSDLRYRLMKGDMITEGSGKGAVINFALADANGLEIGDEMEVGTETGSVINVKIIGVFVAGSERNQMDTLPAVNRIENQIFIDNESYTGLSDNAGYRKIAVYTKNPDQIDVLVQELKDFLGSRAEIATADILYRQLEVPLNRIVRVMKFMLVFTLAAGVTITSILLCMWMRSRKREIAVFISMGKKNGYFYAGFYGNGGRLLFVRIWRLCNRKWDGRNYEGTAHGRKYGSFPVSFLTGRGYCSNVLCRRLYSGYCCLYFIAAHFKGKPKRHFIKNGGIVNERF